MKVLMILDEEFPPDVRVEKEIRALERNGHQIYLLTYTRKDKSLTDSYNSAIVKRIVVSKLMYKFKALALALPFYFNFWKKFIESEIDKNDFDVIHVHDLTLVSTVLKIGRKHNIPVIGDYHENRPEIMKLYDHVKSFPGNILISVNKWQKFQAKYSNLLDRLILVTKEAKDYYIKNFGLEEKKVFVVPNYADLDNLSKFKIDDKIVRKYSNKFMLVYFGDTGSRRGTITVLETALELQNDIKNNDVHFVIIGDSREQSKLEDKVIELKLKNVELTGYMPIEKAVSYFSAADAGLCPFLRNIHHDTTYSNKRFQFLRYGKPVFVGNCPTQAILVKQNNCGWVFTAGDSKMLKQKIIDLKNKKTYKELSDNSLVCVKDKFNTSVADNELIKVYASL